MASNLLETASVQRVQAALLAAGAPAEVVALSDTARSAEDAARAVGAELGAIVKSLVFVVGAQPVLALVAGDRRCREKALPTILGLAGRVRPVAHATPLPTAIDESLARFATLWAAAGHPYCVFATTFDDLCRLTGGVRSPELAA